MALRPGTVWIDLRQRVVARHMVDDRQQDRADEIERAAGEQEDRSGPLPYDQGVTASAMQASAGAAALIACIAAIPCASARITNAENAKNTSPTTPQPIAARIIRAARKPSLIVDPVRRSGPRLP